MVALLTDAKTAVAESRGLITNLNSAAEDLQLGAAKFPEIGQALAGEAKDLPGLVHQTQSSRRELEPDLSHGTSLVDSQVRDSKRAR
jgi:hypothetical protein